MCTCSNAAGLLSHCEPHRTRTLSSSLKRKEEEDDDDDDDDDDAGRVTGEAGKRASEQASKQTGRSTDSPADK